MIKIKKINFQGIKQKFQVAKPWDDVIIFVLNILIAIPVFIILHQNLINPNWPLNIDRVVLFIVMIVVIQVLLRFMRTIILFCIILYFLILIYGSTIGNYGFNSVFEDYNSIMYTMSDNPYPQDIIIAKLLPFPSKSKIINAIEYQNPKIRNFAIMATSKHFKDIKGYSDYRTIIQCFAVFKEINNRWNYVSDPKGGDYIATATESLLYFSGDCDDHSILMAASIKAIGGTPRLIHTKGHIYPEILIGSVTDLEKVNFLIKNILFVNESKEKKLFYHVDERGQIWMNLDYTARYPGGPFLSEEILGALTLN
ncbi:transglutaminase [Flavobacterium sp. GSP27]|uniref:transglutaminase n=1 Tax=unclassified Flavobacterium TaxID=196869 RepID=UPI000F82ACE8|nr:MULTISPECIES: transglutaminase [unclassified Flavobacterium]RTY96506.1 transglutaminase [Flavobacterium sp. GSN2]RTY75372.1 transglutaminase [Flavobacterium sp. LS1R10]RTY82071.1 transglutaminase [Flavobacterium sp. LS1P28]RTY84619.1 transglutaminase [Flavobacterium sp. ZB4P23]RTY92012.1 transglutaminase [Flavobacterium sp. RSP46]